MESIVDAAEQMPERANESWYLVEGEWWRRFKEYATSSDDSKHPGEIDNSPLLEKVDEETFRLKEKLREKADFVPLPRTAWRELLGMFGGGPEIRRLTIATGLMGECSIEYYPSTVLVRPAEIETVDGELPAGRVADASVRFPHPTLPSVEEVPKGYTAVAVSSQANMLDVLVACGRALLGVEHAKELEAARVYYTAPARLLVPSSSKAGRAEEDDDEDEDDIEAAIERAGRREYRTLSISEESKTVDELRWRSNGQRVVFQLKSDRGYYAGDRLIEDDPEARAAAKAALEAAAADAAATGSKALPFSAPELWVDSRGHPRGVVGFHNLGNTCFMNAALQCVRNTPMLATFLLAGGHVRDTNTDNPLGTGGEVTAAFAAFVRRIYGRFDLELGLGGKPSFGARSAVEPSDFKYRIGRQQPRFRGYSQHDSQELLSFLLDGLHEDLNRVIKKPYVEEPSGNDESDQSELANRAWQVHLQRNKSVIVDLFTGLLRNRLQCVTPDCGNVSVKFDPFSSLTVPLPSARLMRVSVFVGRAAPPRPLPASVAATAASSAAATTDEAEGGDSAASASAAESASASASAAVSSEGAARAKPPMERTSSFFAELELDDHEVAMREIAVAMADAWDAHNKALPDGERDHEAHVSAEQLLISDTSGLTLRKWYEPHEMLRIGYNYRFNAVLLPSKDHASAVILESASESHVGKGIFSEMFQSDALLAADRRTRIRRRLEDWSAWAQRVRESGGAVDESVMAPEGTGIPTIAFIARHAVASTSSATYVPWKWECPPAEPQLLETRDNPFRQREDYKGVIGAFLSFPTPASKDPEGGGPGDPNEKISTEKEGEGEGDGDEDGDGEEEEGGGGEGGEGGEAEKDKEGSGDGGDDKEDAKEEEVEEGKKEEEEKKKGGKGEEDKEDKVPPFVPPAWGEAPMGWRVRGIDVYRSVWRTFYEQICDLAKENGEPIPPPELPEDRESVPFRLVVSTSDGSYYRRRSVQSRILAMSEHEIPRFLPRDVVYIEWKPDILKPKPDEVEGDDSSASVDWGALATKAVDVILHPLIKVKTPERVVDDDDEEEGSTPLARGALPLSRCLKDFCAEEQLSEQDTWFCPKCREHVRAYKRMVPWKLPPVLVLHLKRFKQRDLFVDRNDALVHFPIEGLDMAKFLPTDAIPEEATRDDGDDGTSRPKLLYDLYAVDNHMGGLGGGHYTAYARSPTDGQWYEFDDSWTRPVAPADVRRTVVSTAAYVLFYVRRGADVYIPPMSLDEAQGRVLSREAARAVLEAARLSASSSGDGEGEGEGGASASASASASAADGAETSAAAGAASGGGGGDEKGELDEDEVPEGPPLATAIAAYRSVYPWGAIKARDARKFEKELLAEADEKARKAKEEMAAFSGGGGGGGGYGYSYSMGGGGGYSYDDEEEVDAGPKHLKDRSALDDVLAGMGTSDTLSMMANPAFTNFGGVDGGHDSDTAVDDGEDDGVRTFGSGFHGEPDATAATAEVGTDEVVEEHEEEYNPDGDPPEDDGAKME